MLNVIEIRKILELLDRVQISGAEAEVVVQLKRSLGTTGQELLNQAWIPAEKTKKKK